MHNVGPTSHIAYHVATFLYKYVFRYHTYIQFIVSNPWLFIFGVGRGAFQHSLLGDNKALVRYSIGLLFNWFNF